MAERVYSGITVKQLGQPAGPKVGATFPHPALGFLSFLKNIYLAAPSLSWGIQTLNCSMWDLAPWPGIELEAPALGAPSLSY